MASELLSARAPPELRKLEFEEVGTGSKIPKVDSPTKRYPPFNVGRVFEHNDEELPEPDLGTDEIFWEDTYSELGDSDDEDLFRNEDSGPPELTEEQLQELDRKAIVTEINRLTEMQAVARKPLQELQRVEERETEGGETSTQGTKWLTTKFVFDWRFRNGRWTRRARLVAREFRGQEVRNDTFSPATSASLVRLIPVLGLQQEHCLYSVDVKDAFLHLLEVFSDSDWAGRKDTRRSTSSGTIFLDGQCIYSFSRNQKSVSLSSGEAEYYAGASAASDSILLQEAVKFLTQRNCKVHLHMDSSAARGIITRQGVGRVKRLQIRTLFLQDLHKQGTISVHPVGTKENTADIGTKPLSAKRIRLLLHWLGFQTSENEPVGKEELKEHKAQTQAKAAVRMIKSKGNLSVAALLFAGISVSSEGLQCRSFQEGFSQEQCFQQESFQSFKEVSFSMSACVQDVMSADMSACVAYSTVVLTVLRATGLELMDTGASNLGISSAAVTRPKLQLFDLGSWHIVPPPKLPSMKWTGFRSLLDKFAPARSGWIKDVLAREGGLGSTRLMLSTLLQECQGYREVLIEQGILLADGSLDPAISQIRAQ